jgi:RNA polymerase sigma-70 factor (ECF subfamily)
VADGAWQDDSVLWFLAWQQGDEAAFNRLYRHWRRPLLRWLTALTGDPVLAEDLYQETWMTALRMTERYEPRASFRTWLFGMARSRWLDRARQRGRRVVEAPIDDSHDTIADGDSDVFAQVEASLHAQAYQRCLPHVPDTHREAFLLRTLQGMEWRDVGEVVGITAEAARTRCRQAVARLKLCMGLGAEPA